MKSGTNAVGLWIVGGVTAMIFSFLWWNIPDLANSLMTVPRFAFYRMVTIAVCCCGLMACFMRSHFSFSLLDWSVLLWTGYVWTRSLMGDMVEYRVRLIVLTVVLYFVFRYLVSVNRSALRVILAVFMVFVIMEGVYGFCQLYGWSDPGHALFRLTGSFFNPGPYACFLAIGLCVAFSRLLKCRKIKYFFCGQYRKNILFLRIDWVVAWTCLVIAILLLPATMSRSAWLASVGGCGVVAWREGYLPEIKKRVSFVIPRGRWRIAVGCFILFLLLAGVYVLKKDSADGRLLIWKISLLAMCDQPALGVGLGHFGGIYGNTQAAWFASGKATFQEEYVADIPEYGFNEYLQMGVELGGIGLSLFMLVLVIAYRHLFHIRGKEGVIGGLTCWGIFAWFSYPLSVLPLVVTLVMLLALSSPSVSLRSRKLNWEGIALICICLLLTVANVPGGKEWREAYAAWREEQTYFNMKIYEGTVDHYTRLYPLLRDEPRFLFEYGQCLCRTGKYDVSSRVLKEAALLSGDPMFYNILGKNAQALGRYDDAAGYFRHAARMVPNRLYPLYLLACLYFDTGQTEKACEAAFLLLQKEPKIKSDAVREMKNEVKKRLEKVNTVKK